MQSIISKRYYILPSSRNSVPCPTSALNQSSNCCLRQSITAHCNSVGAEGRMGPCGKAGGRKISGENMASHCESRKREELKRKKTPAKMWPLTQTFWKISFELWLTINFATWLWCIFELFDFLGAFSKPSYPSSWSPITAWFKILNK